MAIESVRAFFAAFGMEDRVLEFAVSSATVELAAQALNCEPCRIAKTLSFTAGGSPILIVTAGDAKIDNAKYKARFGTKAKMLTPEEAVSLVGHAVGGVCPFAVKEGGDRLSGRFSETIRNGFPGVRKQQQRDRADAGRT